MTTGLALLVFQASALSPVLRAEEDRWGLGISITTLVDLMTATAREPGSRLSSWTASVLINDTTRCGPHCISTFYNRQRLHSHLGYRTPAEALADHQTQAAA